MIGNTRQSRLFLWTVLFGCMLATVSKASLDSSNIARLNAAKKIRQVNPDSASHLLMSCYVAFIENRDTLRAVDALASLAQVNSHQANFGASYDNLWNALLLADQARLDSAKAFL